MIDWVIYYEDGSSFTSENGEPGLAPRDGVQVVAVRDDRTDKLIWHSFDFYCWQGEWVPRNEAGLYDYLRQPGKEKIVLQARGIGYRKFVSLYEKALEDNRLPFKYARDAREPEAPL